MTPTPDKYPDPRFQTLDEAERESWPAPWKMVPSGWENQGKPAIKFDVQAREGVFSHADGKFVYEAKWSTRPLLDAYAQLLSDYEQSNQLCAHRTKLLEQAEAELEKAKEALRFYAVGEDVIFSSVIDDQIYEADYPPDDQSDNPVGQKARNTLKELGDGE